MADVPDPREEIAWEAARRAMVATGISERQVDAHEIDALAEVASAAVLAALDAENPPAPISDSDWPTIEQQEAVVRGCSCMCVDPGSPSAPNPQPPEWEQNPYCFEHPEMAIVLPTLDNARARGARLEAALRDLRLHAYEGSDARDIIDAALAAIPADSGNAAALSVYRQAAKDAQRRTR